MLSADLADQVDVVSRTLHYASIVASLLILCSFALFARDQLSGASEHQQNEVTQGIRTTPGQAPRAGHHGQPRRFIDSAAKALSSPFRAIAGVGAGWAREGISTVLGLLVYGFGLGFLARYARARPGYGSQ